MSLRNRVWKKWSSSAGNSRRSKSNRKLARPRNTALERLDERRMMAADLTHSGYELTITADPAGSQVMVADLNPYDYSTGAPLLYIQAISPNGSWSTYYPKFGIHEINFVGSNQDDVFTMNTGFRYDGQVYPYLTFAITGELRGNGGDDTLSGGIGNDRIYGGSGHDTLRGNAGADMIAGDMGDDTIDGGTGNDRLYGDYAWNHFEDSDPTAYYYQWGGADTIDGGTGNDEIHGGGQDDVINGGAGDDKLYGGYGNDLIHGDQDWDWLYGQFGDDRVYGGGGTDYVYGGDGNDALYGGYGTDWLSGGSGADRILVHQSTVSNDTVYFPVAEDAVIYFRDGVTDYKNIGSNIGCVRAYGRRWSEADIEEVDDAFGELMNFTGNTTLLKTSTGRPMTFERYGTVRNATQNADGSFTLGGFNGTLGGWNTGTTIAFTNNRMLSGEDEIHRVVFHELGHNWDEASENTFVTNFRAVAGWRTFPFGIIRWGYEQADDNNWSSWYFINRDNDLDGFARSYGKMNPKEDFATSFAAYMMSRTGRYYKDETPAELEVRLDARFDVLDDFFESVGATV